VIVAEQRHAGEIRGCFEAGAARESWRTDDYPGVVRELFGEQTGVTTVAVANAEVERLEPEVDQLLARRDPHIDVGVQSHESAEPGNEPARAERRHRRHGDHGSLALGAKPQSNVRVA
jgi:hypothetical protein